MSNIVHIVTLKGNIIGVFDMDNVAATFAEQNTGAKVATWIVSDSIDEEPTPTVQLTKKDCYNYGDAVMFDDGDDKGEGLISFVKTKQGAYLYRIAVASEGDQSNPRYVWMLHAEIIGLSPKIA